jgi:hypothetical protein
VRVTHAQWFYYEHMMRERIEGALERWSLALPPPVVTAMVKGLDADDLDLMLRHPAGLLAQVCTRVCVCTCAGAHERA